MTENKRKSAGKGMLRPLVVTDPLKPPLAVLVKLGACAVHADEMRSYHFDQGAPQFHFDLSAMAQTLDDPEVKDWIAQMTKLGFMPVKR